MELTKTIYKIMKTIIIALLFLGCSVSNAPNLSKTLTKEYLENTFSNIESIEFFTSTQTTSDSILVSTSNMAKVEFESFTVALFEFESESEPLYQHLRGAVEYQRLVFPSEMNLPNTLKAFRLSSQNIFMFVEMPLDDGKKEVIARFKD